MPLLTDALSAEQLDGLNYPLDYHGRPSGVDVVPASELPDHAAFTTPPALPLSYPDPDGRPGRHEMIGTDWFWHPERNEPVRGAPSAPSQRRFYDALTGAQRAALTEVWLVGGSTTFVFREERGVHDCVWIVSVRSAARSATVYLTETLYLWHPAGSWMGVATGYDIDLALALVQPRQPDGLLAIARPSRELGRHGLDEALAQLRYSYGTLSQLSDDEARTALVEPLIDNDLPVTLENVTASLGDWLVEQQEAIPCFTSPALYIGLL